MTDLDQKHLRLKKYLKNLKKVIIAYSGGIDSALLLKVANEVLGQNVLAVTADSPSVPRRELQEAKSVAELIGARHLIVQTEEMDDENYARNPMNRCYFCKSELYSKLIEIARQENIPYIANGTNVDDLGDYRPGLQAADEFKVVSPLKEAGLTKQDIRDLAKQFGLQIWDKPATPCLSSRIPYGSAVTPEKLAMVEAAENFLKEFAIKELRVRHFGETAKIEVAEKHLQLLENKRDQIARRLEKIGFTDFEIVEFKSGALNSAITSPLLTIN